MRRRHGQRARLGGVLLAALGALALLALPSVAAAKDRNHDHIPDRWEKRHHLSLKVKQSGRDQDRDQLRNRAEFLSGNDPRDSDSDNDGVEDGDENAGTIASFDPATGRLTIDLFGGDTVTGTVTDETRIECGHGCRSGHDGGEDSGATASHEGEDNSGPGSEDDSSGPDPADQPGDDPAGGDEGPSPHADDPACTTDALVAGAVVEEAELELRDGVATFTDIELGKTEDASTPNGS